MLVPLEQNLRLFILMVVWIYFLVLFVLLFQKAIPNLTNQQYECSSSLIGHNSHNLHFR